MLHLILGRSKSGKSTELSNLFAEYVNNPSNINYPGLFITPEQFSLISERRILTEATPKVSILYKHEITNFKRLIYSIITKYGSNRNTFFDSQGKLMILTNILNNQSDSLSYFKKTIDKPHQIISIFNLFNELDKCCVKPETFDDSSLDSLFSSKNKIKELSSIYKEYCDTVNSVSMTETKLVETAIQLAKVNNLFDNRSIFIDEFTGFTGIQFKLLEEMIASCKDVYITLPFDRNWDNGKNSEYVFNGIKPTIERLIQISHSNYKTTYLPNDYREGLLSFAEHNFTKNRQDTYNGVYEDSIEIHNSLNIFGECDFVASNIEILHKAGVKYSDIIVCTGNVDSYSSILQSLFSNKSIPYFVDNSIYIINTKIVTAILNLLQIAIYNFEYEDVIAFLRCGLYIDDICTIDEIENKILSKSYKGINKYLKSDIKQLAVLADNVSQFTKSVKNNKKLSDIVDSFEELLNGLSFFDNILQLNEQQSEINEKIVEKVKNVFAQMKQFLGETTFTSVNNALTTLYSMLNVSFSSIKIAQVPQNLDAVSIVSINRSRFSSNKVLFLVGANENVLPAAIKEDGLLNNFDREELRRFNIELSDDAEVRNQKECLSIYTCMFAPKEHLYISYLSQDETGKPCEPSSYIITKMKKILGNNPQYFTSDNIIESPKTSSYTERKVSLSRDDVRNLFGLRDTLNISISRIENYSQCPFNYLLKYGVSLKNRQTGELTMNDIGSIIHKVIEISSKSLFKDSQLQVDSSDEKVQEVCENLVNSIFDKVYSVNFSEYNNTKRVETMVNRVKRSSVKVLKEVYYSIKNTKYNPAGYEYKFNSNANIQNIDFTSENGNNYKLSGQIDRFDLGQLDDPNKVYIRAVDYKSSNKVIKKIDVENGTNIQLVTYLDYLVNTEVNSIKEYMPKIFNDQTSIIPGAFTYHSFDSDIVTDGVIKDNLNSTNIDFDGHRLVSDDEVNPKNVKFTLDDFNTYSKDAHKAVGKAVDGIIDGNFSPNTITKNGNQPCKYCDYYSICGIAIKAQ